jgi:hypothetical protein
MIKCILTNLLLAFFIIGCNLKERSDPSDCKTLYSNINNANSIAVCNYKNFIELNISISENSDESQIDSLLQVYSELIDTISFKTLIIRISPKTKLEKYKSIIYNKSIQKFPSTNYVYKNEINEGFSINKK